MLGLATGITNTSYQWQPTQPRATMKLWLRNNVGVSAARWDDSSGSGNHAVQSTSGNQASVVDGGLDFEGGSDHFYTLTSGIALASQEGFATFIVCKIESFDTQNTIWGTGDGKTEFLEIQTADRLRLKIDGDTDIIDYGTNAFGTGSKMVICLQREAGSTGTYNVFKNGTELTGTAVGGSSNLANPGAVTIASLGTRDIESIDREFDGVIYEVLVYDTVDLEDNEIAKINNYLKNKHGIT